MTETLTSHSFRCDERPSPSEAVAVWRLPAFHAVTCALVRGNGVCAPWSPPEPGRRLWRGRGGRERHAEVRARRERRREELERQGAVTLQGVERLASALVLPHPESDVLDLRRLRPHPETEMTAMRVAMEHEVAQGRRVYDVHKENLGYDVTSLDLLTGELRLIEVKGSPRPAGASC